LLPLPQPTKPESEVLKVLREYRAKLDGMELAMLEDMARRWLEIERRLDADIVALAYEMERRQKAGEVITQQMIWRAERYQILKAQLTEEIRKYNRDYAVPTVTEYQRRMATLGINAANDAIITSFQAGALARQWTKINVNAVQALIGFAGDGSPLYTMLKNDYPDAVDGIVNALVNGLARGLGPAQIASDMANGMSLGLDRAMLIARTETARAYRAASIEQYRQSGVVDGFMRLVKKETACMACLMLDGERFETADELDDHPRGKCVAVPIVAGAPMPTWQKGPQWFLLQTEEKQKAMMGVEKYNLWKDGKIDLKDLAQHSHSDVWGDAPRVATLKELLK
jgi:SPP1 gp7 family putative phage head morphogenesis protein